MFGEVARRLRALAGRRRVAAVGVAAAALMGTGLAATTAGAQILPTPTPGQLCILILCPPDLGNPLNAGTQSTPTPTPTPSCTVTCLPPVNPTCDVTTNPGCLIANSTPTPCQSNCGGGSTSHSNTSTTSTSSRSRSSSTAQSLFGAGNGGDPGITGPGGGAVTVPVGVSVATVPTVEQLGPASGLQFGHAPILWPLFGILDVLGLAAVVTVFRRLRSAEPD